MELANQTVTDVDISAETEVLSYAYESAMPVEVIARVDVGNVAHPLAGTGGNYTANIYVNSVLVSPATTVLVASGVTRTILVSRPIPLVEDDVISIRIVGQTSDTGVTVVTTLRDATPAKISDLVGVGSVSIDHNYGGTDALRVVNNNDVSVGGMIVLAYLASDYDARQRSNEFVRGRTTTAMNGRWQNTIDLNPDDYVLVFSKPGEYITKTVRLTVE